MVIKGSQGISRGIIGPGISKSRRQKGYFCPVYYIQFYTDMFSVQVIGLLCEFCTTKR